MSNTNSGVLFTPEAARQTVAAVRAQQSSPGDSTAQSTGRRLTPTQIKVKITTPAAGNGKYKARSMKPPANVATAGANLTEADIGVPFDTDNVLFLNLDEINAASHSLATDTIIVGDVIGVTTDTPALLIVEGRAGGILPVPQYSGMVLMAGSDNQLTGNWMEASPMRSTGTTLQTV